MTRSKNSRVLLSLCAAAALYSVNPGSAEAATYLAVPADTCTGAPGDIYQLVAAAVAGDIINAPAGVYPMCATLNINKEIAVQGAAGTDFDCAATTNCVYLGAATTPSTLFANVEVHNAANYGVYVSGGKPIIRQVVSHNNADGLHVRGATSQVTVEDCTFHSNTKGMAVLTGGSATVLSSTFVGNNRGLVPSGAGYVVVVSSDFQSHTAAAIRHGGAGTTPTANNLFVMDSFFAGNWRGIEILGASHAVEAQFVGNTLVQNSDYAVYVNGSLVDARVHKNEVTGNGGGIFVAWSSSDVENNLVLSNWNDGIRLYGATARVAFNTIANNQASGIWAKTGDNSLVTNNIIYGSAVDGFHGTSSVTTQLGNNDAFMSGGANYSGPFVVVTPNISVNPVFMSLADFHLQPVSPLLNGGDLALHPLADDYDGVLRNPGTAEIGAFEIP